MAQPNANNRPSPTALSEDEITDLSIGTPAERAQKNLDMWHKYKTSDVHRAYVHLERAWNLGTRDKDSCQNLVHLMQQENRMHDIQRVLQQAAYSAAEQGDKSLFIDYVHMYHRYTVGYGLQVQDPIINDLTEKLFAPLRPDISAHDKNEKPHLVYLVPLPHDPKSTLPPIPFEFTNFQKDSEFKISIVLSLSEQDVAKLNPRLLPLIDKAKERDISIHFVDISPETDKLAQIQKLTDYLTALNIDVLCCFLQLYNDYFTAAMRPARHVVGIEFGHPEWYSSPFIDGITAAHRHLAIEAHTQTLDVCIGVTRVYENTPSTLRSEDIGISSDKKIIISSGAKDRLHTPDFWKLVHAVIQSTNYEWVVMGVDNNEKTQLLQGASAEVLARVHCLGYRDDFSDVLSLADIYVDTFPVGGGYALIEAMALNIPCVTYKHDYNRIFNKHQNYFPMCDYIDDPEFAININGHEMLARINAFMNDDNARAAQIKRQDIVLKIMNTPERGIKELDEALIKIARS